MADTYYSGNTNSGGYAAYGDTTSVGSGSNTSGFDWKSTWDDLTSAGSTFKGLLDTGSKGLDFLGKVLGGEEGKGAQVAGIAGLSYLLNQLGGQGDAPKFSAYQGSIPTYTATREQLPIPTTMTTAEGKVVPRRPGSGGVQYFKPITYTKAADGGLMGIYPSEPVIKMADGGITSLGYYSDGGRLARGPGDGVSDSIDAVIGDDEPARIADGEFVVPARIVSELGNGSTEAGARKLYAMMDRIQKAREKSMGKDKVAVNSKADKHLPA